MGLFGSILVLSFAFLLDIQILDRISADLTSMKVGFAADVTSMKEGIAAILLKMNMLTNAK